MQKKKNYIILLMTCMLCGVIPAFADYPIGKKRTAITGTFNYFYSSKYFNDQGKLISNNPGDYFQASSYSLNISHGLSRRVDMSVTIPFASQTLVNGNNSETKSGVTDINLGLSVHFPSVDYKRYFTIRGSVGIPGYQNNQTPYLGYASKSVMLGANYSFTPYKNGFAIVEFIYSRFLDAQDGPNQYRAVITMGKMYNKHTSVTASLSHQVSQSVNTAFNPNLQLNKNFNAATLNLSIGRKINRMITPTLQAYYTLLGKNAGLGMGANIFVTVRLP
jgi:protein XagA